jgi:DNA polymerase-3 subunit gamma/tau
MQNSFFTDEEMGAKSYRVLARKYRPTSFKDMVGQEVLVRTLTNAISSGRLAHAFVLTGIRGVGKTTTARIIARALNCIGPDGNGNPTADPCGVCPHCKAIAEDKHQDVFEMDAASHTGVNDIREIIENTRYRPISARYKVYIIDEVHMLSNSAFNALLKTLEEPPPHVKFIFATTEIRKIPITILSRCQRFDLKRVEAKDLVIHFNNILSQEGLKAESDALKLIASVASGSVRDGLSILDQALAFNGNSITSEAVREMLGLADSNVLYKLYEAIVEGKIQDALTTITDLYRKGADPSLIIIDLLNINHLISKLKLSNNAMDDLAEQEKEEYKTLADKLAIPYLARLWQMLLKGLDEVKIAYSPFAALEMLMIRITHASNLPSPEDIIRKFETSGTPPPKAPPIANSNTVPTQSNNIQNSAPNMASFEQIIETCFEHDEMIIYHHLRTNTQFISLTNNSLSLKLLPDAPKGFVVILQEFLSRVTNQKWQVIASNQEASETIANLEKSKEQLYIDNIVKNDSVQNMIKTFGDLEIVDIKNKKIM